MQERSCLLCFETVLGMNKITPTPLHPLHTPYHSPKIKKIPKTFFYFNDILRKFIKGVGVGTPSFNRCKIAHTLLGRSCTLCFEIVLGMNKITPTPSLPQKKFPKNFILIIFLRNLFKGVGLATLSLNMYNMAQGLLRRSCFKYVNRMKKLPLPLPPHLKN